MREIQMEEIWQKWIKRGRGGGGGVIDKVEGMRSGNAKGHGKSTANVVQDQMTAKHGHDVAVSYLTKNSNNFESLQKYTGYDPALHAYSEYYTGYNALPANLNPQYSPQCHFNRYTGVQSVQHYFHPTAYPSHGYYGEQSHSNPYMQQVGPGGLPTHNQGTNLGLTAAHWRANYSSQFCQTRPMYTESHDKPAKETFLADLIKLWWKKLK